MESYANIAATNAPPPEKQPHPDPALLTTPSVLGGPPPDITTKVNVARPDNGEPLTYTTPESPSRGSWSPSEDDANKNTEAVTLQRWEKVKEVILRPSVVGGLVGIVNIGLLAGGSYAFYSHPNLRRDTKIITSAMVASFALFGTESYAIKTCRNTPKGNVTDRKIDEGSTAAFVYHCVREHVPRSGVFGGTAGLVNAGILSIVGYLAYRNWDSPNWDRRAVSAASVCLLALWGSEIPFQP